MPIKKTTVAESRKRQAADNTTARSAPMVTTDKERLKHLEGRESRSAPQVTTREMRLAHLGFRGPRNEAGEVTSMQVDSTTKERVAIARAALRFKARPTQTNLGRLLTLVENMKGREVVDANEPSREVLAREKKEARDREAAAAKLTADDAAREALLADAAEEVGTGDPDVADSDPAKVDEPAKVEE